MVGTVEDTYVAALQHDLVDLEADRLVGVVRRPTPWFHGEVDENVPALAPPEALLEEFKDETEALKMRGMCDEGAHNAAWENLGFAESYREHLQDSDEAQAALADLVDAVRDGESIALVCYENTAKKRCHRTVLRDQLEARLADQAPADGRR